MANTSLSIVFTLIGASIALAAFFNYRKRKNLWLLLSLIIAILAAGASWLAIVNAGFLGVSALALLGLGIWSNQKG